MSEASLPILMEVVNLFVQKDRRERFVELFSKPKRYDDGLWDLLHDPRYFDEQIINKIPSSEYTPEQIYARLKKLGFQDKCVVFSPFDLELNGKTLPTLDTLEKIGDKDAMIFCTASKIGYYEGHEGWRYILKRK